MMPWVDIETTGLDADWDDMLEIGLAITTDDLVLVFKTSFVIKQLSPRVMPELVLNMHTKNGLLADVPFGVTMAAAEAELVEVMERFFHGGGIAPAPMCGSSVHFDRAFLKRVMPRLEACFHYRNIDTSTVKELVERWPVPAGNAKRPVPLKLHRVDPDLTDSIAEMRFYKELLFDRS